MRQHMQSVEFQPPDGDSLGKVLQWCLDGRSDDHDMSRLMARANGFQIGPLGLPILLGYVGRGVCEQAGEFCDRRSGENIADFQFSFLRAIQGVDEPENQQGVSTEVKEVVVDAICLWLKQLDQMSVKCRSSGVRGPTNSGCRCGRSISGLGKACLSTLPLAVVGSFGRMMNRDGIMWAGSWSRNDCRSSRAEIVVVSLDGAP